MLAPDNARLCSSEGLKKKAVGPGDVCACRKCAAKSFDVLSADGDHLRISLLSTAESGTFKYPPARSKLVPLLPLAGSSEARWCVCDMPEC